MNLIKFKFELRKFRKNQGSSHFDSLARLGHGCFLRLRSRCTRKNLCEAFWGWTYADSLNSLWKYFETSDDEMMQTKHLDTFGWWDAKWKVSGWLLRTWIKLSNWRKHGQIWWRALQMQVGPFHSRHRTIWWRILWSQRDGTAWHGSLTHDSFPLGI